MRLLEGSDKLLLLRAGRMVAFGQRKEILERLASPSGFPVQPAIGATM